MKLRGEVKFMIGVLALIFVKVEAQIPSVQSLSSTSARADETISIKGINFGTDPANVKVFFGGVSATPKTISDQFIEVAVPAGAAFDNVQVVNTALGLSGNSVPFFCLSFGGGDPFNPAALSSQSDFQSENGLYDVALADFDGDGKLDVVTANNEATQISLFRNTGTPGTVSFAKTQLNPAAKTLHVCAGDLNGDGKPEIVLSEENGERLFLFKNNSTPGTMSFVSSNMKLTGSKSSSIRIADLDRDGKSEIIVTDQSTSPSRLFVVPNQSTLSALSFGSAMGLLVPGTSGTDGVSIADLDGDQFPEIVVSEFLNASGKLFILKNQSLPGNINLSKIVSIQVPSTLSNVRVGDLNADGKPDIAATLLLSSNVLVMANNSTSSDLLFGQPEYFEVDEKPWGLDFGDVDGDGKTDIAVASLTQKSITVLNNTSAAGSFSFKKTFKSTSFINRYVRLADVDNDGRPDFAFTSINDNNLGVPASKVSVIRNIHCVVPKILPNGPLTICNNFTQRLTSSINGTATYEWFKDGASAGAPGTVPFMDVTQSGSYTVNMTSDGGSCARTSSPVQVTVVSAAPLGTASVSPVSPVCLGGTLSLSVSNVGADKYVWTGPANYTAEGINPSRAAFTADHAGKYKVAVMVGTCVAQEATVIVDVVSVPGMEVHYLGADLICEGETKVLSVTPVASGYTYQWVEQATGPIAGATNQSYTATASGKYFLRLKSVANPSCASLETSAKKIRIAKLPKVDFTFPAAVCLGASADFTDKSVLDIDPEDKEINYEWTFGDNEKSTLTSPGHKYAAVGDYNVKLSIGYRGNACSASKQQVISVVQSPALAITSSTGSFNICKEGTIQLQVGSGFTSYKWSNGQTTSSIAVTEPGDYSVEVTSTGCKTSTRQTIGTWPEPVVVATADPESINLGAFAQLKATGLAEYEWHPGKTLSDSLVAAPVATPIFTTTYTVTGKDNHGCTGNASVEVIVIPDNILNLLHPKNYFTPNGDGINDFWKVENIQIFDECSVTIYDEKGLKLYDAKPYINNWDGVTSKGQVLSSGVYYYIIQCESVSDKALSGSINIIR